MVREAGLQNAIRAAGFERLAEIVAVCDDESVLGVPFYVMRFLDGHVITTELPAGLERPRRGAPLGLDLVDTLVEIHAADVARIPSSPRSRARAATSSGRCAGSRSSGRSTRRASCRQVEQVGGVARRAPAGTAAGDGRARRLPPRQHDGRSGRADADPRGARLGDGRDRRSARGRRLPARHLQRAGRPRRARSARRR